MGQYHHAVNLDKREYLNPHDMGLGLKQWEQVSERTALALVALLSCSNGRGGGDLPEVEGVSGRWAGDRIAFVGDYTEEGDIESYPDIDRVYGLCGASQEDIDELDEDGNRFYPEGTLPFTDITPLIVSFIEEAENGIFVGQGWKQFVTAGRYFMWDRDRTGRYSEDKIHGTVANINRESGTFTFTRDDDGVAVPCSRDNAPYLMASDVPGPRMAVDMLVTSG